MTGSQVWGQWLVLLFTIQLETVDRTGWKRVFTVVWAAFSILSDVCDLLLLIVEFLLLCWKHCDFVLGRSISSASSTWCVSVFVHKELSLWCTLVMTLQWNTISASRLTKWVCADDLSFMAPFSLFVMVVLKPWFPLSNGVTCTVSPNTLYTPCKCVSNDFVHRNVLGLLSKQSELRKHDLIQTIKPDSHLKVFCPLPLCISQTVTFRRRQSSDWTQMSVAFPQMWYCNTVRRF